MNARRMDPSLLGAILAGGAAFGSQFPNIGSSFDVDRLHAPMSEGPPREPRTPGFCKCGQRISLHRDSCLACKEAA